MFAVPQRRAAARRKEAVINFKMIGVPEGVLTFKAAPFSAHVLRVLQRRFPRVDRDVRHHGVREGKKRAFAAEFLVFNEFHGLRYSSVVNGRNHTVRRLGFDDVFHDGEGVEGAGKSQKRHGNLEGVDEVLAREPFFGTGGGVGF